MATTETLKVVTTLDKKKKEQGFLAKGPTCSNCKHFSIPAEHAKFGLRCSIGNFKVGRSNYCPKHEFKS